MKKIMLAGVASAIFSTSAFAGVTIEGTGSSFQYPANKAWAKMYFQETGNKVNYSPTGSGTGIKEIKAGHVDFGGSDKPLKPSTLAKFHLGQFPIAIGAITFSYNIPGVSNLKLSEKAIAGIVLGQITHWDDAAIKAANPGVNLPHKPVLFVHRSDKSGTTYGFTYYLSKMSKTWKAKFGAKKTLNWPMSNQIAGKGNFGVSTAIKTNPYSIGYVDYADAVTNKLNMATIENAAHNYVAASKSEFEIGAKFAKLDPKIDFYANIQYPPKGYPVMAATFVLLPKNSAKSKQVADFYKFAFSHPEVAEKLGYVALPKSVTDKVEAYMSANGM